MLILLHLPFIWLFVVLASLAIYDWDLSLHWHGAADDSWFAHLAFEVSGENASSEWLEPVYDEAYDKLK